jgi:hypothetical protein
VIRCKIPSPTSLRVMSLDVRRARDATTNFGNMLTDTFECTCYISETHRARVLRDTRVQHEIVRKQKSVQMRYVQGKSLPHWNVPAI